MVSPVHPILRYTCSSSRQEKVTNWVVVVVGVISVIIGMHPLDLRHVLWNIVAKAPQRSGNWEGFAGFALVEWNVI